jgi:hypothetical protein
MSCRWPDRCPQPDAGVWACAARGGAGRHPAPGGELPPGVARQPRSAALDTRSGSAGPGVLDRPQVQRARGEAADPQGPRPGSILPNADALVRPGHRGPPDRRGLGSTACRTCKQPAVLVESLETTLDLLDGLREEDDDALYFHPRPLPRGDAPRGLRGTGADPGRAVHNGWCRGSRRSRRGAPLAFPATRWLQGAGSPGFSFDNERAPHPVAIPSSRSTPRR